MRMYAQYTMYTSELSQRYEGQNMLTAAVAVGGSVAPENND